MKSLRVFHLPALVGDHGPSLARLERARGHRSTSISETPHVFGFHADVTLLKLGENPFWLELRRVVWFLRILLTADVVHYNWGRTLFPDIRPRPNTWMRERSALLSKLYRWYGRIGSTVELALLRARGVRIVVTFQGNDARQTDRCLARGATLTADAMPQDEWTRPDDLWKGRVIKRFDRFAHSIFALNPDLLWVLPKRAQFLPYLHWKSPDLDCVSKTRTFGEPLVIVHAPSVRSAKGTDLLEVALKSLRSRGVAVTWKFLESLPHSECVATMREASVFVDQLLIGWYGGAAVEAMSLGIPTIACIRKEDLVWLPPAMRESLPIVPADPSTIEAVLEQLARMDQLELKELGQRTRAFASYWHDPNRVVEQVLAAYEPSTSVTNCG